MNNPLSDKQQQNLRKIENLFRESVETVLQTSISPDIIVAFKDIAPADPVKIKQDFADGCVSIKVAHKDSAAGEEYIIVTQPAAARISDLMVMGDGSAEFNPSEHIDAIQEIVDQIFGAYSNTPSDFIFASRDYALARASYGGPENLAFVNNNFYLASYSIHINGDFPFCHLYSKNAVEHFLEEKSPTQSVDDFFAQQSNQTNSDINMQPRPAEFQSFAQESSHKSKDLGEIEMLMDLRLQITIELGRTSMFIRDVLKLAPGSIIELEKLSGDPIDIYVNDKKFAEGEVVVIDENFGVRITELLKPEDRIKKLS